MKLLLCVTAGALLLVASTYAVREDAIPEVVREDAVTEVEREDEIPYVQREDADPYVEREEADPYVEREDEPAPSTYAVREDAIPEVERKDEPAPAEEKKDSAPSLMEDPELKLLTEHFVAGHRTGGKGQINIGKKNTKLECLLACYIAKKTEEPTINSVDYGVKGRKWKKSCYCNKGSSRLVKGGSRWITSRIDPKNSKLDSSLSLKELRTDLFISSAYHHGGKGQINVGTKKNKLSCLLSCYIQSKEDPAINSADYGVKGDYAKVCYCNKGSTGEVLSPKYTTSLISLKVGTEVPSGSCANVGWWSFIARRGLFGCSKSSQYFRSLWRDDPSRWSDLDLIVKGYCCKKNSQLSGRTCSNANWRKSMATNNSWSKCPNGYFMQGFRRASKLNLENLTGAQCCRPKNASKTWGKCYIKNIKSSFDYKGWGSCKKDYYLVGLYRSNCNSIHCIEYLYCCRMDKSI